MTKRKWMAGSLICCVSMAVGFVMICCSKTEWRHWLDIVTPVSVIIGGAFACWKYAEAVEVRRREAFCRLMDDFRNKAHESTFYGIIERDEDEWYLKDLAFVSSEHERRVDGLLLFFEDVLNLHKQTGLVSAFELKRFEYYLDRISDDTMVAQYLSDLEKFCADNHTATPLKCVTDYVKQRRDKLKICVPQPEPKPKSTPKDDCDIDRVLKAYFLNKDGMLTRSAKSVISRMKAIKRMTGLDDPVGKHNVDEFCKDALNRINRNSSRDVAASLRSALRHWYRAVTNGVPNF